MKKTKLLLDKIAARLFAIGIRLADRVHCKNIFLSCVFALLPARWSAYLTILFRHYQHRDDLDGYFKRYCGPELAQNQTWLYSSRLTRGYENEVQYYLFLSGHYQRALDSFASLDWGHADESLLRKLDELASGAISGYSMNILARLHLVGWQTSPSPKETLARFSDLVRLMLNGQTFEFEGRIYRTRQEREHNSDLAHAKIDRYVPYFFRNKPLIEKLQSELDLPRHPEIIFELDNAGQSWEPFPDQAHSGTALRIALYYAYRYLYLRTYNNGEGAWAGPISDAAIKNQDELRRSLPAVSNQLKAALQRVGISEPGDLHLLSPDWSTIIGHTGHLNVHMMMRELGWWSGSPLLLTSSDKIANRPFLSLMKDRCPTWILEENTGFADWHEAASLMPFTGMHGTFKLPDGRSVNWNDAGAMAVAEWERQGRGFPLRDSWDKLAESDDKILEQYDQFQRKHGMTTGDWYVCLHMRDAATRGNVEGVGESIRNTDLRNYLDSIEHVLSLGGWVVRMGGPQAPPLSPMERVIDYARSAEKSPEMDIHLVRHARMFIGTTSGFAYVASSLGIPSAIVDAISSMGLLLPRQTRFTTKLVHTETGRILSLAELTSDRFRWSLANFETLAQAGLTVEDNSPDEILEAVKEVLALTFAEPERTELLTDDWKAGFEIPDFFGAATPSKYFIDKHPGLLQSAG